jgi:hypothetical protein
VEKVAEVRDFVSFLKERYGKKESAVDSSDSWTEEDLRDLTTAVLRTAEDSFWTGESPNVQSR